MAQVLLADWNSVSLEKDLARASKRTRSTVRLMCVCVCVCVVCGVCVCVRFVTVENLKNNTSVIFDLIVVIAIASYQHNTSR